MAVSHFDTSGKVVVDLKNDISVYTLDAIAGSSMGNVPFVVYNGQPNTEYTVEIINYRDVNGHFDSTNKRRIQEWTSKKHTLDDIGKGVEAIAGTNCNVYSHRGSWLKLKLTYPTTGKAIDITINWI